MSINHAGAFDSSAATDIIGTLDAAFSATALSNATLPAGALSGSLFNVLNSTANGANALTTRTASQIIADLDAAMGVPVPKDGTYTFVVRILSAGNGQITLTAGAGVTVTGTATIASGAWRDFLVTVNSTGTVTFQNVGGGTI